MANIGLRCDFSKILDLNYFRSVLLILLALPLLSCGSEEPQNQPRDLFLLSANNQRAFVRTIVRDYLITADELLGQYKKFELANNLNGFINYRNDNWTPVYIENNRFYQSMLHKNKAFIYRNQLDVLFDSYNNLQQLGVHLKHSLRDNDTSLRDQVYKQLKRDRQKVTAQLKVI